MNELSAALTCVRFSVDQLRSITLHFWNHTNNVYSFTFLLYFPSHACANLICTWRIIKDNNYLIASPLKGFPTTRLVIPRSTSSTSNIWYVKSRGLKPDTCSVYGPLQETVSFIEPLTRLVTSKMRKVLEDEIIFF